MFFQKIYACVTSDAADGEVMMVRICRSLTKALGQIGEFIEDDKIMASTGSGNKDEVAFPTEQEVRTSLRAKHKYELAGHHYKLVITETYFK